MKNHHFSLKTALSACALAVLALGQSAIAQDRGGDRRDRDQRVEQRGDPRDGRRDDGRDERRANDDRRGDDRRGHDGRWDDRRDRRGAGPNRDLYVGHRLPPRYHQRTYVVDNWRGHQLRQPPRGYHWVQSGSDYLLVAIATGLIANAILNGG